MASLEQVDGTPMTIAGFAPFRLRVKGGRLFVNVVIYNEKGQPPIEVHDNQFVVRPVGWDRNSNHAALEVVNAQSKPIFQMIYEKPNQIRINGLFPAPGHLIQAEEGRTIIDPSQKYRDAFSLKPIFKYPAWKYPGEYAEQTPEREEPAFPTEHLTVASEAVPSQRDDLPFGLRVVVQTNVVISPTHIRVECNGPIGDARFGFAGPTSAMFSVQTSTADNVFDLYFGAPPFAPQAPLVITLYSVTRIKVLRVAHVP